MISKLKIQNSWIKTVVFILILSFYGSILVHKIALPVYDDLPRQIKIGEEIIHGNFDVLYKNVFSYTEPDQTFFNHHWLSGIIFYVVHGTIGWNGLVIFKTIILLLAFSLVFFTALKKSDFWLVALTSIPTIIILTQRTGLRPEIFSYLFIAVFLYVLFDLERNPESKKIFWLIPLQLFWVNMHVFFSVGIMLVASFLFEKVHNREVLISKFVETIKNNQIIRKLSVVFIALLLVSCINPRGIGGVFYYYPQNFPALIGENQTLSQFQRQLVLWQDIPITTYKVAVFILMSVFILYFWKKRKVVDSISKLPIFYILGGISAPYLGYSIVRALALFAIMFLLIVTALSNESFIELKNKLILMYPKIKNIIITIFVIILVGLLFPQSRLEISPFNEPGLGLTRSSLGGLQFFKENNLYGPIFNNADLGSYLIYGLYPKERVFVDNRFADAYSYNFFGDVYFPMMEKESLWLEVSKKYDFGSIFFYQYDASSPVRDFLWRRMRDPAWSLVYVNMYNMIFVRNISENKDLISQLGITRENVGQRLEHLTKSKNYDDQITAADIFNLIGREDLGSEVFLQVVYKWPEKGKIWMVMGEWELARDQYKSTLLAMMYLEKAISLGYKSAESYSFLGAAYNKLGQRENAINALEKALRINPDRRDAKDLLYQLDGRTQ